MDVFRRLLRYLAPYRLAFAGCLGLVFLASTLELLKPWPVKLAVDQVIGRAPLVVFGQALPMETWSVAMQLGAVIALLILVHFATGFVQLANNYLTIRIGQNMVQDFRADLFAHLERQSLLFHQKMPAGDLLYRLMGDTYAVQSLFMNGVFSTLSNAALLLGMFCILLGLDVELTLYSLAVVPCLMLAIKKLSGLIGHLSMESATMESRAYATAERILSAIGLVQAFGREADERSRFLADSKVSFDRKLALYSLQTAYGWIIGGLTATGTALVLYVGVTHVLAGTLTTGELLVFLAYLASLYAPLNQIATTVGAIQASLAQAKRILDLTARDEAVPEAADAVPLGQVRGEVRFSGVSFGYDPARPVLAGVSCFCPPGSLTALVGQTGAGKTTCMSLLLRFFDPQTGTISIDGTDIRRVTLASLRANIAVVLQDTQLFPMSLRENIAYGRPGAGAEEIEEAARLANAMEFIEKMPQGLDTVLGEKGSTLSGGQRQRVAIARAILKNAPILILDEPTSALDAGTEALIMEGLDRLMAGRTTFVIAHRLSLARRADQILVIRDHGVSEAGTFEELLALNGEFARLHALQSGTTGHHPQA
jgi:ATP-binding cassette subfamily B protein/subfamily B ATP-binding cassette protein MsbA